MWCSLQSIHFRSNIVDLYLDVDADSTNRDKVDVTEVGVAKEDSRSASPTDSDQ